MSFDDLPPMPPMLHPEAASYAERVLSKSRAAQQACRVVGDVAYGNDYWQRLDIYLPQELRDTRPMPVLCYLHGGAWSNGCKEWMGFLAPVLVDLPMIFVSLSYRRAPQVRMPEIAADCFDALAWVHRNIAAQGGDPHRLYVGGHSAGAHLAALLALRTDLLESRGIPPGAIRGCFPTSGTFDFRLLDRSNGGVDAHVLERVLRDPGDAWEWSPVRAFQWNPVPFFASWGERDFPRVVAQGRLLAELGASSPGRVRWEEVPSQGHFSVNEAAGEPGSNWSRTVREMMSAGVHAPEEQ
jgi:arylformamidase